MLLVVATAAALVFVVSDHVTRSAIDSSVSADRSLGRGFVDANLSLADFDPGAAPARVAAVDRGLAALVDRTGNGILQIKIWAPTGIVLYSDRADLSGKNLGLEDDITDTIATRTPATIIEPADQGEAATVDLGEGAQVLEEYLPIELGGTVPGVFEIYRNAGPILAHVEATRRDVILVTTIAAALLALLLHAIFRAAQVRLARQTEALLEATRRDALTGMLNHGAVVGVLADEVQRSIANDAAASGGAVGVALIDIDNFKLLNDTHGHDAGDRALLEVARLLRAELSEQSTLGRFGPDEFLAVAPPSCAHDLEPAVERLRERLAGLSLQFGGSERLPVSVSAGICFSPEHGLAATELLSVATIALGEAKASGGNGVRIADRATDDLATAQRSSFDVLSGLVVAVDTKDRYTKRHSEDVARYALFIADRLGLDADLRRTIEIAGLLHDVGKIGIPDGILRKPGPLTAEEYAIVKQHVALGDAIVRDLPNLDLVRAAIRHHHERWDGSGYLHGLAGDDIPLIARILAVVDAFSAMTTTRPYRKALSVEEALRRLEDAAGTQLDAVLVRTFVSGIETAASAPLPGDGRPLPRLWTPAASVA
jgi:diguanylate cyclase (GGDEF)-like protein/putative nucleotidyltransferase with HDIG domain